MAAHLEAGEPSGWFEPVYAAAGRDHTQLPWVRRDPHPYLVDWLDDPVAEPPGRRAIVVGCGWGDDAALLAARGFEVVAFDIAASAIARARRRFRRAGVDWRVTDLLDLPDDLIGGFDLVVEVDTVPWLPGVVRDAAMHAIARLAAERGVVVVVTRLATGGDRRTEIAGPPWAQVPSELTTYREGGLVRLAVEHPEPDGAPVMDARLTWQRPTGEPPATSAIPGLGHG